MFPRKRPAEHAEASQGPASSIEVAEAFKELMQATFLVSKESPGLDLVNCWTWKD